MNGPMPPYGLGDVFGEPIKIVWIIGAIQCEKRTHPEGLAFASNKAEPFASRNGRREFLTAIFFAALPITPICSRLPVAHDLKM
jgi:hypothetical protein